MEKLKDSVTWSEIIRSFSKFSLHIHEISIFDRGEISCEKAIREAKERLLLPLLPDEKRMAVAKGNYPYNRPHGQKQLHLEIGIFANKLPAELADAYAFVAYVFSPVGNRPILHHEEIRCIRQ